jgi:uncharacterized membrane protein YsdA (DUF1294 family)
MRIYINYLILINLIAFFVYAYDKLMAKMKKSRVRETTLLSLSIFGGALGGFISMILFNHKTKVKRFIIINILMILLYVGIYYYFGEYVWN